MACTPELVREGVKARGLALVGFGEIIERGVRAADALPDGLVYAGFSLGVLPAQKLAQTRDESATKLLTQRVLAFLDDRG